MPKVDLIPAFDDNYIFALVDEANKECLIVDPGDAKPVIDYCESNKLKINSVLITHHHSDHTGGAFELQNKYLCPVYKFNSFQFKKDASCELQLQSFTFNVYHTPGHTLDHIVFYEKNLHWLFCGDTLFSMGCGRLFEGSYDQMYSSLNTLKSFPPDSKIYCAHEYTLKNLDFFCKLFPEDIKLHDFRTETLAKRKNNLPTIPSRLKTELELNPFLKAKDADEFQRLRELRNKN